MEPRKYLKNCWSKFFISIVIIIGGVFVCSYWGHCHFEEERTVSNLDNVNSSDTITTSPRMISTNIEWKDSVYKVVMDEMDIAFSIEEEKYEIRPFQKTSLCLSDRDTLIADSLLYAQLKEYRVMPQYRIDSIYDKEGINGLFSTYFDRGWLRPRNNNESALTLPEERYIIYLLQLHGYSTRVDCESGYIYIEEP